MKQIHLSTAERVALANELLKLGEPIEKIRRRGENVKRSRDFGRISFDVWLNWEPLYTEDEAWKMVREQIEKRKGAMKAIRIDEEELESVGLVEIQEAFARRREEYLERVRGKIKVRIREARKFLLKTDEHTKQRIKVLVEERGLSGKDNEFWRECLPFYIPHILPELEAMMKEMPQSTKNPNALKS